MKHHSLLPLVALLIAGCGGQGVGRMASPRLAVKVAWPTTNSRVIPTASNSILIKVIQSGVTVAQTTIVKPATTTSFTELPTGASTVTATAYPTTNATGTAMATASVAATIVTDATEAVSLTMASTIDHLTITPNPVNLALTALFTKQITVTAYDLIGNVVLMDPTDISYATSNSLLFNVNATGLVTGLVVGTATITATDAISGKSATATVKVTLT